MSTSPPTVHALIAWRREAGEMGMYRVKRAFFHAKRDLIVLTGQLIEGDLHPGLLIDLPRALRGPGCVPVHSVEPVVYASGESDMAVTIQYHWLETAPLFEPSMVEGRVLEVTR